MSYNYPLTTSEKEKAVKMIDAEIMNLEAERVVLEAVAEFTYSGKVFNRRYETQLSTFLGDKFGRIKIDQPYGDKTHYNAVNTYMSDDTSYDGTKKYTLNVSYKGYALQYNYDDKSYAIGEKNESHRFYSVKGAEDVTELAKARIHAITTKTIPQLHTAINTIDELVEEHNRLEAELTAFNDKVPYIVSDILRIK